MDLKKLHMNDYRWEIFLAQEHYEGFKFTGAKVEDGKYYITFTNGDKVISEPGRRYENSVLNGLNSIDKYLKSNN